MPLGEYRLNTNPALKFTGRDRAEAKRKALSYWYEHRDGLNLSLKDFFDRCRLSSDERTIWFFTMGQMRAAAR